VAEDGRRGESVTVLRSRGSALNRPRYPESSLFRRRWRSALAGLGDSRPIGSPQGSDPGIVVVASMWLVSIVRPTDLAGEDPSGRSDSFSLHRLGLVRGPRSALTVSMFRLDVDVDRVPADAPGDVEGHHLPVARV